MHSHMTAVVSQEKKSILDGPGEAFSETLSSLEGMGWARLTERGIVESREKERDLP